MYKCNLECGCEYIKCEKITQKVLFHILERIFFITHVRNMLASVHVKRV